MFKATYRISAFLAVATLFCGLSARAEERPTPLTLEELDYDTYIHLDRADRVEVLRIIREYYVRHDRRLSSKLDAVRTASLWPSSLHWLRVELFPEAFAAESSCTKVEGPDWINAQLDCNVAGNLTCIAKVGERWICGGNDKKRLQGECKEEGQVQCDKVLFPSKDKGPLCAKISGRGPENPTTFCDANSKPLDENSSTLKAEATIAQLQKMKAYCKEGNPAWDFNQEDCKFISGRLKNIKVKPEQRKVASAPRAKATCSQRHLPICKVDALSPSTNSYKLSIQLDDKSHQLVACDSTGALLAQASFEEIVGEKAAQAQPLTEARVRQLLQGKKRHVLSFKSRTKFEETVQVTVPLGDDKPESGHDICETKVQRPLVTKKGGEEACTYSKDELKMSFEKVIRSLPPGSHATADKPLIPDQITADCNKGFKFQVKKGTDTYESYTHPWETWYASSGKFHPIATSSFKNEQGIGTGLNPGFHSQSFWQIYSTPGCGTNVDRNNRCVLSIDEVIKNNGQNGQLDADAVKRVVEGFTTTQPAAQPAK